jgi:amidohydrolase
MTLFNPASTGAFSGQAVDGMLEALLPSLLDTYTTLHASPELTGYEEQTAAYLARELKGLDYTVTTGVGKYENSSWQGHGVVAVLRNGTGPTVLVRSDMDALPVEEQTGLPYASRVRARNRDGDEVPVMHACGHDIHMTALLGTARLLVQLTDRWRGTVVLIGQPAEEGGGGARAMLAGGAKELYPEPDYVLALHNTPLLAAGTVGVVPGYFMAGASVAEVVIRGLGAHGSSPESGKDPIVMAAQFVLALQTIVSRETSPFESAVVTVGTIHGGTARNIIPDEVQLQLSIRTYEDAVRDRIFASIRRIALGIALTAGVPEERAPLVDLRVGCGATWNDPQLTERVSAAMKTALGEDRVQPTKPVMGSEDFSFWSLDGRLPICMFWVGAADPQQLEASRKSGKPLPSHHSPFFAPLPEPTIRTGVRAMTAAVVELLST